MAGSNPVDPTLIIQVLKGSLELFISIIFILRCERGDKFLLIFSRHETLTYIIVEKKLRNIIDEHSAINSKPI